jgi:hypothetical protein
MEPISAIAMSLALGAGAIAGKEVVSAFVRDAYTSLKGLLRSRYPKVSVDHLEQAPESKCLGRKNWLFAGSDAGGERAAAAYSLIETALCRARRGRWLRTIRHSLVAQSVSRKASNRSFGWKRVRLPPWYGLSLANAASLSARCACR